MQNAGWTLGVEYWQNTNTGNVGNQCRRGTNWFGWSPSSTVGTVSVTLQGNGEASLDFGNCWNHGEVNVYLNENIVATAPIKTFSKKVSFNFNNGDILKLRDEGWGSVITINDIIFRCSSGKIFPRIPNKV